LHGLDSGADAYVRKGEDTDVLLARLAALLRRSGSSAPMGIDPGGPSRILAIDDSPSYLAALAAELEVDGHEVLLGRSGEEGLTELEARRIDCILLDRMMPGLGGIETCRRIRSLPTLRGTPVVMLTGSDERTAIIEGLNAGADDYIVKSSDFEVLKGR